MEKQSYSFLYDLIQGLTGIQRGDVFHLEELCQTFDVQIDDILEPLIDMSYTDFNINVIIGELFEHVLRKYDVNFDLLDGETINIYTNSIDSHLYIKGEEVYNLDDLKRIIEENPELLEEQ